MAEAVVNQRVEKPQPVFRFVSSSPKEKMERLNSPHGILFAFPFKLRGGEGNNSLAFKLQEEPGKTGVFEPRVIIPDDIRKEGALQNAWVLQQKGGDLVVQWENNTIQRFSENELAEGGTVFLSLDHGITLGVTNFKPGKSGETGEITVFKAEEAVLSFAFDKLQWEKTLPTYISPSQKYELKRANIPPRKQDTVLPPASSPPTTDTVMVQHTPQLPEDRFGGYRQYNILPHETYERRDFFQPAPSPQPPRREVPPPIQTYDLPASAPRAGAQQYVSPQGEVFVPQAKPGRISQESQELQPSGVSQEAFSNIQPSSSTPTEEEEKRQRRKRAGIAVIPLIVAAGTALLHGDKSPSVLPQNNPLPPVPPPVVEQGPSIQERYPDFPHDDKPEPLPKRGRGQRQEDTPPIPKEAPYTVQSGDTLNNIIVGKLLASHFENNPGKVPNILRRVVMLATGHINIIRLNIIQHPDKISPGDILKFPSDTIIQKLTEAYQANPSNPLFLEDQVTRENLPEKMRQAYEGLMNLK